MKKIILSLTAMMLSWVGVSAQSEPGTFSLQPKIGITTAALTNMPDLDIVGLDRDYKLKKDFFPGALIGAEAEYRMTPLFSVAAGLNFALQGGQWKDKAIGLTRDGIRGIAEIKDTKIELGYVNLPIVANFYVIEGLALKTGVQFGLLTYAKSKSEASVTINGITESEKENDDIMDECNKFDFSIPVGVSYEFSNNLVLDARYIFGLTKINKEVEDFGDLKNRLLTITIGYKFDL